MAQVGTEWRKVAKKLEGEEIFEALDKVDRLEVYQVGEGGRGCYTICLTSHSAIPGEPEGAGLTPPHLPAPTPHPHDPGQTSHLPLPAPPHTLAIAGVPEGA